MTTNESTKYYTTHKRDYDAPDRRAFMSVNALPDLVGAPWNDHALGIVHSLRPSSIRVTYGEETCDARLWRVTVHVDRNDIITRITQEVAVVPHGEHQNGLDVQEWMRGKTGRAAW